MSNTRRAGRLRWSLRATALALLLPLVGASLWLSALTLDPLLAVQRDLRSLRAGALRSIYVERLARHFEVLLTAGFDLLAGEGEAHERVEASRRRIADTLAGLEPLASSAADGRDELTARTLGEWEEALEQVERHFQRALGLTRAGKAPEARHLLADNLEILASTRVLERVDSLVLRERARVGTLDARLTREAEHRLLRAAGFAAVGARVLPDVFEAVLAERFARRAYAELRAYTHHLAGATGSDETTLRSRGQETTRALAQLANLLQRPREADRAPSGAGPAWPDLSEAHARMRAGYARILELEGPDRKREGEAILATLEALLAQRLVPRLDAIVAADEQAIERGLDRLEAVAAGVLALSLGAVGLVLAIGLGSPLLVSRLLVKPISDLAEAVDRFLNGDSDARPDTRRSGELGFLARGFDALANELGGSRRRVRALAFYDVTTGLPNREYFKERLQASLVSARLKKYSMGLLSIDLGGFQQVNDALGHEAGDELLREVAERLRGTVRLGDLISRPRADGADAQLSRVGGDQFTIMLARISDGQDWAKVSERVLASLAKPFDVAGRQLSVSANIGIAIYPVDGGDAETLLRNAEAAMNHSKSQSPSGYQFYSEAMNAATARNLHIRNRLSGAIERQDLALHYQPLRDAQSGRVVGAEALLRWTDGEMGPVQPLEFIPIAEESGLILPIGEWVLYTACAQGRAWRDAGFREIRIAVNVSAHQLRQEEWVEKVAETLQETGFSADRLELELTESATMEDNDATLGTLKALRDMGVGIALDDFGTGHSSLSYLKRFPIGRLKIDRSFVSQMTKSREEAAITEAILAMAKSLGLGVVAEGVETVEQAEFLRERGCPELQGYLISRPVAAADFTRFLEPEKPEPA